MLPEGGPCLELQVYRRLLGYITELCLQEMTKRKDGGVYFKERELSPLVRGKQQVYDDRGIVG